MLPVTPGRSFCNTTVLQKERPGVTGNIEGVML